MRIIGGEARGRTLIAPSGNVTRPTQDYVRESLFNILQGTVRGTAVLDLFAGTGALSLEAISRGAGLAVLVEKDRAACAAIRCNIERVRAQDRCELLACDYRRAMAELSGRGMRFNLVFLDPPYRMEHTGEMCRALCEKGLLAPDCLLVVEHRRDCAPRLGSGFGACDFRCYGDTQITFVRRMSEAKGGEGDADTALPGEL